MGERGPYKKRPTCRQGHLFTAKNTYYAKPAARWPYGRRICRRCAAIWSVALYRTDPARRETVKTKAKARYWVRKSRQGEATL